MRFIFRQTLTASVSCLLALLPLAAQASENPLRCFESGTESCRVETLFPLLPSLDSAVDGAEFQFEYLYIHWPIGKRTWSSFSRMDSQVRGGHCLGLFDSGTGSPTRVLFDDEAYGLTDRGWRHGSGARWKMSIGAESDSEGDGDRRRLQLDLKQTIQ